MTTQQTAPAASATQMVSALPLAANTRPKARAAPDLAANRASNARPNSATIGAAFDAAHPKAHSRPHSSAHRPPLFSSTPRPTAHALRPDTSKTHKLVSNSPHPCPIPYLATPATPLAAAWHFCSLLHQLG